MELNLGWSVGFWSEMRFNRAPVHVRIVNADVLCIEGEDEEELLEAILLIRISRDYPQVSMDNPMIIQGSALIVPGYPYIIQRAEGLTK